MEKIINKFEQTEDGVEFQSKISICGQSINVFCPFNLPKREDGGLDDLEIPECSFSSDFEHSDPKAVFHDDTDCFVDWLPEDKKIVLHGKKEEFDNGTAMLFIALSMSEYLRQKEGKILLHGAAVELPSGEALVLLGDKGDGKSTMVYYLCKNFGCKLLASDQVFIGLDSTSNELNVLGGTKNFRVRKTATSSHLSELSNLFPEQDDLPNWESKINLKPDEVDIQISLNKPRIKSVVWLKLDPWKNQEALLKRNLEDDLVPTLNLSEKLSRHINGGATPIIGNGKLRAFSPSLDDAHTLANRKKIYTKILRTGFFSIFGGDIKTIANKLLEL